MSGIIIVDLGTGNLRSVSKAVQRVCVTAQGGGARVRISDEAAVIAAAGHLILPGQGALGAWIKRLDANPDLRAAVLDRLQPGRGPALGICLGLQALYTRSEENDGTPGFNLFPGTVRHFAGRDAAAESNQPPQPKPQPKPQPEPAKAARGALKIPHMGWNRVRHTRAHPLWRGIADRERFYFVHSYFVDSETGAEVVGECEYGRVFTAAAARDNLFATQFHPEKSQRAGLQLLQNFVNWDGA